MNIVVEVRVQICDTQNRRLGAEVRVASGKAEDFPKLIADVIGDAEQENPFSRCAVESFRVTIEE